MDRVTMKTEAKSIIKNRVLTIFAMVLIIELVLAAVGAIPAVGFIAIILATGPAAYAITRIFYQLAYKNKTPEFKDLIVGFEEKNFTRSFLAWIRFEVFTFLWSLLFCIPGIIKSISYSQMFYLLVDHPDMDAATAQKKSMELMEGHKMEYFVLQLSFIPWYLLIGITFGIASIYVIPYLQTTMTLFYKSLTSKDKSAKETKEVKEAKALKAE